MKHQTGYKLGRYVANLSLILATWLCWCPTAKADGKEFIYHCAYQVFSEASFNASEIVTGDLIVPIGPSNNTLALVPKSNALNDPIAFASILESIDGQKKIVFKIERIKDALNGRALNTATITAGDKGSSFWFTNENANAIKDFNLTCLRSN